MELVLKVMIYISIIHLEVKEPHISHSNFIYYYICIILLLKLSNYLFDYCVKREMLRKNITSLQNVIWLTYRSFPIRSTLSSVSDASLTIPKYQGPRHLFCVFYGPLINCLSNFKSKKVEMHYLCVSCNWSEIM